MLQRHSPGDDLAAGIDAAGLIFLCGAGAGRIVALRLGETLFESPERVVINLDVVAAF